MTTTIPDAFTSVGIRLDLLVTGWVALALIALGIVVYIIGERMAAYYVHEVSAWMLAGFGALAFVVWLIMLVPYNDAYHRVYTVSGTVESVSNVVDDASGELTSTPVVDLSTIDRPVVVNDPRITGMTGVDVTLTCTIAWHYRAADTYSCEIYSIDGGAR